MKGVMNKSQMSLSLSFCFSALSTLPPGKSASLGQLVAKYRADVQP